MWAARHQYAYMNLGALISLTKELKQVYIARRKRSASPPARSISVTRSGRWWPTQTRRRRSWAAVSCGLASTGCAARWSTWTRRDTSRPRPAASRPGASAAGAARPMGYEDLQQVKAIIVGSPETVIKKLSETIKELNPAT